MIKSITKKIKQISKSKNKIIRVVHKAALIYAVFLTLKNFFIRKKSEKVTNA